MTRCRLRWLVFPLLLMSAIATAPALAEIYKWVDAEGKVHFGDKPVDPGQAAGAEEVELNEGYRPTERTAEEQEAYRREQQLLRRKTEARQRVEQKAMEERRQSVANKRQRAARLMPKISSG